MGSTGVHTRRPGEYVRPPEALDLMRYVVCEGSYLAVGTFFHQPALQRFRDGESVVVEMVPEPHNPFDGRAVALDIDGLRIGYLRASAAWMWHDIVRSCNRAGLAVWLRGTIRHTDWGREDDLSPMVVAVELPSFRWRAIYDLAVALGFRDQHDAVMNAVRADLRDEMLADAWDGLSKRAVKELKRCSAHARQFTWVPKHGLDPADRVPYWHVAFLREDVLNQREYAATLRELKRLLRREVKRREKCLREQEAAARKRKRHDDFMQAIQLQAAGRTHAETAVILGVPAKAVPGLLQAGRRTAPEQAVDWHVREQSARIDRAREALRLQRAGLSRAVIATELGCSMQSIKDMLADARFYENPSIDLGRHSRARRCQELRGQGLVKEQVLDALATSRAAGLRAFRDAAALQILGRFDDEPEASAS